MDHDRCVVHKGAHACLRSQRRESRNRTLKRGITSKVHLAVDKNGVPVRCIVTDGVTADCSKACELIDNTNAKGLIADKGYDSNEIVDFAQNLNMKVVIPPRKNRKVSRDYDKNIYKTRRLVENAFLLIKRWRGVAFSFAKNLSSFASIISIRCLALWAG